MLPPATPLGRRGHEPASPQADRHGIQVRALLVGLPALCDQLAKTLEEQEAKVVGRLRLDDGTRAMRAASLLDANVVAICPRAKTEEWRIVQTICRSSERPVVVFSEWANPELLMDCLEAGASGCLRLPSPDSDVLALLAAAAATIEQPPASHTGVGTLAPAPPESRPAGPHRAPSRGSS